MVCERVNAQEAIGLREGGDRARAFARGIGQQAIGAIHQRCHDEFGASQFGGHMHWQMGADFRFRPRRQARHAPQHGGDDVVEGEHG